MRTMVSKITSLTIVYSIVYSGADQRKHQSSGSLAFAWGIHRWPVNSPHKGPVTRKMFPFDDVIMSFEVQAPVDSTCGVDFIYWCSIINELQGLDLKIGHQDVGINNGQQGDIRNTKRDKRNYYLKTSFCVCIQGDTPRSCGWPCVMAPLIRSWSRLMMTSSNGNIFHQTLLAFCAGNSPVNSPHKGQWRGSLMFSLICAWTNSSANNGDDGDLRRYRAHYDVIVMWWPDNYAIFRGCFVYYVNVTLLDSRLKRGRIRPVPTNPIFSWHWYGMSDLIVNAGYKKNVTQNPFSWWRHQAETFPRYWPFVRGIHWSPVNSPHKGQWRGALMFSLICVCINGWVNNREAGDLRRISSTYDVSVMYMLYMSMLKLYIGPCAKGFSPHPVVSIDLHGPPVGPQRPGSMIL